MSAFRMPPVAARSIMLRGALRADLGQPFIQVLDVVGLVELFGAFKRKPSRISSGVVGLAALFKSSLHGGPNVTAPMSALCNHLQTENGMSRRESKTWDLPKARWAPKRFEFSAYQIQSLGRTLESVVAHHKGDQFEKVSFDLLPVAPGT